MKFNISVIQSKVLVTLVLYISVILLSGCASQEHSSTKDVISNSYFNVSDTILFEGHGKFNTKNEYIVLAGRYQLEKENLKGKFYIGESISVGLISNGVINLHTGGVWIPNRSDESPRIYLYMGDHMINAKELSNAISIREKLLLHGTKNNELNNIPTLKDNVKPKGAYYAPPQRSLAAQYAKKTPAIQFPPSSNKFNNAIRSISIQQ